MDEKAQKEFLEITESAIDAYQGVIALKVQIRDYEATFESLRKRLADLSVEVGFRDNKLQLCKDLDNARLCCGVAADHLGDAERSR